MSSRSTPFSSLKRAGDGGGAAGGGGRSRKKSCRQEEADAEKDAADAAKTQKSKMPTRLRTPRRPRLPAKPRPMPPRRAPPLVSPDLLLKPSAQNAAMAKNKAATTAAWYKIST